MAVIGSFWLSIDMFSLNITVFSHLSSMFMLTIIRKCLSQMVQSDWLLRGPLFHLETSAEVFYKYSNDDACSASLKIKSIFVFCSAVLQLLSYSCSYQ